MVVTGRQSCGGNRGLVGFPLLFLCGVICAEGAPRIVEFPNVAALLAHGRATRGDPTERVKVRGTITYNHGGYSLFIQDTTGAIHVGCIGNEKVAIGDEVEVLGNLYRSGFSPIITSASMTRLGTGSLPAPENVKLEDIVGGAHDMRLVSLIGTLGACYDHGRTIILTLVTNGIPFHVELAKETDQPNPFASLLLNSTVRLQGVCSVKADRDRTIRSLMVLMRSPADLVLLSPPPYWTGRRVGAISLVVVMIAGAFLAWVFSLRRQVRKSTAEIMRLNEQLEQKVKVRTTELETVNRQLEAFTHSVSHDLKAPVRAIQNFSGLLTSEYATGMSVTGMQFLKRIQHNAENMGKLISALVSFTRVSQCQLQTEMVSTKDLVQRVIGEFSPALQLRRVEFLIQELPKIEGDRTLLKEAISNLISNAIKYSRSRDPARIEIGCYAERQEFIFFVKDNGVGFSPEQSVKLFQPFERLHSTDEYEGSGIGLAIAQRIITRHGGRIWAEADCEKGSTFYWALPKTQAVLKN